jgi:lipopolysaccharide/colanic/teichoic acid biosynthesis glycosyltransferase
LLVKSGLAPFPYLCNNILLIFYQEYCLVNKKFFDLISLERPEGQPLYSAPISNQINSIAKRMLDYLLTIPGFIVISPLLLLVAIAIKLDSAGPILYRQKRVGLNGRVFDMYKFRSMYQNADITLHQEHIRAFAEGKLDETTGVKLKDDSRITRVGRILRDTSIDELPQILNVLKGEMSLVGPRPVVVYEANLYDLWHSERFNVLPGITGLWQVTGRSTVSFDEQLRLDIRYIRNQSLWLDIIILLKTFPAVLSRRGAG